MSSQRSTLSGLEYEVHGEGNPVIALHGSASTAAQWKSLTGYLEGRFRIYTPNLPGYGGSAPAPTPGLAGDAQVIGALIDRIGTPVHLVGHSYGGALALKLASSRPDAVRSLTVIEPVAFHLLRRGTEADRRLYDDVMWLGAAMDPDSGEGARIAGMRRFIDYWNGPGAWARSSPALRDFFLKCHDRVRADFAAIAGEEDGMAELARIGSPTLAIMGLDSPTSSSPGHRDRRPCNSTRRAADDSRCRPHGALDRSAPGRSVDRRPPRGGRPRTSPNACNGCLRRGGHDGS